MSEDIVSLIPHLFEGQVLVRRIMRDGEPWFVAKDVCMAIGIKNNRDAVEPLDEDEKGVAISATAGGPQEHIIISESGLYALILRSHAALRPGTIAHRFRKWVTAELLPSIRKTGAYGTPNAAETQTTTTAKLRHVAEVRLTFGPAAAAELYIELGLKVVPKMLRDPRMRDLFDPTDPDAIVTVGGMQ